MKVCFHCAECGLSHAKVITLGEFVIRNKKMKSFLREFGIRNKTLKSF